ncbi:hypothetical protein MWU75_14570 [Ornithinimicrobium sp. F0845]|uniref:hypothetical protein n=1 Tax=Ornithinimicrobium sp. F0845 TaxID=2926412 RepID=UPI001FF68D6E|nr:hypothetical protein [Ornithinimicrobium sp. F0845]MCK0113371.1 hypothetical protein [Ornithinimicrobium sp. F0845]
MWSWQIKAHQTWIAMIVIGVIFTLGGLGVLVGALLVDDTFVRWVLIVVGVLVLVVGVAPLAYAPRARRETGRKVAADLVRAEPKPGADTLGRPWPVPVLAGALAHELQGTPYVVEHNDRLIRVTWDLGDRSWWVLAQRNGTRRAFETRLVLAGPGKVTRTDHWHSLDWQAGVPVLGSVRSQTSGGRVWRYEKRIELGTDRDGLTRAVEYTFSTEDLDRPLAAVLQRAGWDKPAWGAEAKGALIVAGIGASSVVLVPLGFLLNHWLG